MRFVLVATVAAVALALAGAAQARIEFFRMPSGNIACVYSSEDAYLRCDIRSGLKPKPPRPRGCVDLEWGDSLSLGRRGRASVVCHGDTVFGSGGRILRYGTSTTRGPFVCTSRTAGLTCENLAGHGFFISRQSWQRF